MQFAPSASALGSFVVLCLESLMKGKHGALKEVWLEIDDRLYNCDAGAHSPCLLRVYEQRYPLKRPALSNLERYSVTYASRRNFTPCLTQKL